MPHADIDRHRYPWLGHIDPWVTPFRDLILEHPTALAIITNGWL